MLLDCFGVACLGSLAERPHGLIVPYERLFEPFLNLQDKDLPHLAVGDDQLIPAVLRLSRLRQVACRIQHAPQIIDAVVDFVICQFQSNGLLDSLAIDQAFNFALCRFIRLVHEAPDQVVAAGVDPVRLRSGIRLADKPVYMVDYIPRAVHIHLAEAITVVPLLCFGKMLLQIVAVQYLSDFRVGKAEVLVKTGVRNG